MHTILTLLLFGGRRLVAQRSSRSPVGGVARKRVCEHLPSQRRKARPPAPSSEANAASEKPAHSKFHATCANNTMKTCFTLVLPRSFPSEASRSLGARKSLVVISLLMHACHRKTAIDLRVRPMPHTISSRALLHA